MKLPGKWIRDLTAQTTVSDAAAMVLRARGGAVVKLVRAVRRGGTGMKRVRDLRVAARRADAALRLFRPWIDPGSGRDPACGDLRRALKGVRRAAGAMRDCDLHAEVFKDLSERAAEPQLTVLKYLIARTQRDRARAETKLLRRAERLTPRRVKGWRKDIVAAIRRAVHGQAPEPTMRDAARAALPAAIAKVREAVAQDLTVLTNLHTLRLLLKRLRYSLELLGPALGERFVADVYPQFQEVQDRLGEVNDGETVLARLGAEAERLAGDEEVSAALAAGVAHLKERCASVRDRRADAFLEWWASFDIEGLLRALEEAVAAARAPTNAPAHDPARRNGVGHAPHTRPESEPPIPGDTPRRLAAIDVGSNSTRLVIAEARPDGTYRVIDDEKELSRLALGLVQTGRLDREVMERAATIVARLKAIAQGYNCTLIRAIATAAVREASNGAEFVELVRARAGLDLKIVSAEEEARLAFLSASHAFGDMQNLAAGVVDVGGGSTEVVLSSRGVVEEVFTIPVGAVSLTERFGGPVEAAGPRFKEMRRWLDELVRKRIRRSALRPELVVGTGGTVTTLAAIAIKRDRSVRAAAPATVRGYQIRRAEVRRILDDLRDCSLQERGQVPGVSPERADIIVAGVAIIRAVMRRLGTRRLRVHDLGVREGLLLTMVGEVFPRSASRPARLPAPTRPGRLNAARRFARACRYEEEHSERVAATSIQIFDALRPLLPRPQTLWSEPVARELLEAGAVLHDVGYIINYAGHHKHGYHLIVHSDLSGENGGFSRREVEIVANLARYHRRSTPRDSHANMASLTEEDRTLVRCLCAILRIADGLDRTHSQNVRGVRVRLESGVAVFDLEAEHDPATDAWGASRKSEMFREVFGLEPVFEWGGRPLGEPEALAHDTAATQPAPA